MTARLVLAVLASSVACGVAHAADDGRRTPDTATAAATEVAVPTPAPDWAGTWRGTLRNHPGRAGAPEVTVIRELGTFPTRAGECSRWRTIYEENGRRAGVKDYRLCRGPNPDDLYVDEGTVAEGKDVRLAARWLGDTLVSAFEVRGLVLFTAVRVQGTTMSEDIWVARRPEASQDDVPSLPITSLQRLTLERTSTTPAD